ncbi:patatin-like phospholipase family protein [Photobacterium leiognathi]|uniref:Patatin family protein n=2 Tax=Photobacterium leiognathi TaxID=553611 RepID=A0A2T3KQU4_PHOLD|nr:patatin family protein [Photobacterium leiognathi]PSV08647.1 patatin family protein [Photobacterium leiognathi subsp. mandapamensis]
MPGKHISYCLNNLEALYAKKSNIDDIALVTEGGGQRGIFTAGVLDIFLEHDFNPFSLLIGTSAGSLNLASYICEQKKHAYRVITEITTKKQFFSYTKLFSARGGMNLDWLLEQTQTNLKLDWETGRKNMANRTVLATASGIDHKETGYFDLNSDKWDQHLKASCAIPVLNRKPIYSEEHYWVDGGLHAPIPAIEAYKRGYKNIVVIRTNPIGCNGNHEWLNRVKLSLPKTKTAELIDMLLTHEQAYNETEAFLLNPPDDVNIFEIHPHRALKSKLIGSDIHSLNHDYEHGKHIGQYFLRTMMSYCRCDCCQPA